MGSSIGQNAFLESFIKKFLHMVQIGRNAFMVQIVQKILGLFRDRKSFLEMTQVRLG